MNQIKYKFEEIKPGFHNDFYSAEILNEFTQCIDEEWSKPVENTIHTSVFGFEKVKITDCAELNLNHI